MKIAFIYDSIYPYTFGGVEKRIWELSTRLVQRGHDVHIFGPKFWLGANIIQKEGVFLHGVCKPPKTRFVGGRRSVAWPFYYAVKLTPALIRPRFDIIDCQNFPYFPCFSAKTVSMIRHSSLVITWIEVWGEYWLEYLGKKGVLGKFVEKLTTGLTDNIISISDTTATRFAAISSISREIVTIPIGIDSEYINTVLPNGKGSDVIFIGRLVKNKNVDSLLKSISFLKQEYPKISVMIIGDGPEKEALEHLAIDLGVTENIKFVGSLVGYDELISQLKSSRIFVLPSTREGFGIAVIEANACGLPVIVIRDSRNAACELVVDGQNGFICSLSAAQIAEKMKMLLQGQYLDMKIACIRRSQQYNWPNIVSSVESYYEKLEERKRQRQ